MTQDVFIPLSDDELEYLDTCPPRKLLLRRWMPSDVETKDPARRVLNHDEDVEDLEARRNHHEEVAGDDCFGVIPDKRRPPLVGGSPARPTAVNRPSSLSVWSSLWKSAQQ